ncbi:MAG: hypothetical protein AMXMBFR19_03930 [Chthonomonadaceae bacterium]
MAKFHKTLQHDVLVSLLRREREAAGFSQNELSRRLGHSSNYINRVELGKHSLDVVNLLRILTTLGVDPKSFFARFVDEVMNS